MSVTNWTPVDTEQTPEIRVEYRHAHDLSDRLGQAVGSAPAGTVWFGSSAGDIAGFPARTVRPDRAVC